MTMELGLRGKRALVTGAGAGIGRAIAERLGAEGARVALVDVNGDSVDAARATLESAGGTALSLVADVADEPQISGAVARVVQRWGGLDILVANAGIQLFGEDDRADRLNLDVWESTLRVNLTGTFLTCKHGLRALLESGGGRVICVSSPTALYGLAPGFDAYTASKAGVHGLARVMAEEGAKHGVRSNVVCPGFVKTELVEQQIPQQAEDLGAPLTGALNDIAARLQILAANPYAEVSYRRRPDLGDPEKSTNLQAFYTVDRIRDINRELRY
jgi:NAD(P)-dependent dehydrogenase (short-subunit alcohol dehydrogenase family)